MNNRGATPGFWLCLAALLSVWGCPGAGGAREGAGSNDGPGAGDSPTVALPDSTLLVFAESSFVLFEWTSGVVAAATEALTDSAAFVERWDEAVSVRVPAPTAPSIDFEQELVLLAAQGEQPSTGYRIQLDSAVWRSDRVDVYVTAASPDPATCMTGAAITSPIHMVGMPRTDLPIRFRIDSIIQNC